MPPYGVYLRVCNRCICLPTGVYLRVCTVVCMLPTVYLRVYSGVYAALPCTSGCTPVCSEVSLLRWVIPVCAESSLSPKVVIPICAESSPLLPGYSRLRREFSSLGCYSRFTVGGYSHPGLFPFHCWRTVSRSCSGLFPFHCWRTVLARVLLFPFHCWPTVPPPLTPVSLLGYALGPGPVSLTFLTFLTFP